MLYNIDLHIHTSASNCFKSRGYPEDKINQAIIEKAVEKKLNMIAITDHYSLKNFLEIKKLADKKNIVVLPGVELSIKTHLPEKVSILAIFDENTYPDWIEMEILSKLNVPFNFFGNGSFLIEENITDVISFLKRNNILVISSHQDKNEIRLSYIPTLIDCGVHFFDLRYPDKKEEFIHIYGAKNVFLLTFSDAHKVNDVGKYLMTLPLISPSFDGLKKYLYSEMDK